MTRKIGITCFVLYALLITYLSLAPEPEMPDVGNDKVAHTLAYAGFAVMAIGLGLSRRNYLLACLGIVAYGGMLEIGQYFVPGRELSGLDLAANVLGVSLGFFATKFMPGPLAGLKPD